MLLCIVGVSKREYRGGKNEQKAQKIVMQIIFT